MVAEARSVGTSTDDASRQHVVGGSDEEPSERTLRAARRWVAVLRHLRRLRRLQRIWGLLGQHLQSYPKAIRDAARERSTRSR